MRKKMGERIPFVLREVGLASQGCGARRRKNGTGEPNPGERRRGAEDFCAHLHEGLENLSRD